MLPSITGSSFEVPGFHRRPKASVCGQTFLEHARGFVHTPKQYNNLLTLFKGFVKERGINMCVLGLSFISLKKRVGDLVV